MVREAAGVPAGAPALAESRDRQDPQQPDGGGRRGKLLFGEAPDRKVEENGVWYALDLRMNQDASLYLDTRNLRSGWASI